MVASTVGFRIAELRKRAGYSQLKMSELLGISRSLVGQIERDLSKPNLETLSKFVRITNTSFSYIIDGIESSSKEQPLLSKEDMDKLTCDVLYPLAEMHAELNDILNLLNGKERGVLKSNEWMDYFESSFKAMREFRSSKSETIDQGHLYNLLGQTRDEMAKYLELLRDKVHNVYLELKLQQVQVKKN